MTRPIQKGKHAPMPQLTVSDVALGYDGKTVTEHIDFSVSAGDYLCIVGENGSGKSTLMKALLRLHAPLSGTITEGDGMHRSEIGYLPQQTLVQRDFPASVFEIVLSGCLSRCGLGPFYGRKERALAEESMAQLGISHLKNASYRTLSGGQQQRVLLARALAATRKMLLLDEPTAGLDPKVTEEMYELIATLNREQGITTIMVTHDVSAALKHASHILHIADRQLFFGTVADYRESDALRRLLGENGGTVA